MILLGERNSSFLGILLALLILPAKWGLDSVSVAARAFPLFVLISIASGPVAFGQFLRPEFRALIVVAGIALQTGVLAIDKNQLYREGKIASVWWEQKTIDVRGWRLRYPEPEQGAIGVRSNKALVPPPTKQRSAQ